MNESVILKNLFAAVRLHVFYFVLKTGLVAMVPGRYVET
jgi:hypothetical protein